MRAMQSFKRLTIVNGPSHAACSFGDLPRLRPGLYNRTTPPGLKYTIEEYLS